MSPIPFQLQFKSRVHADGESDDGDGIFDEHADLGSTRAALNHDELAAAWMRVLTNAHAASRRAPKQALEHLWNVVL